MADISPHRIWLARMLLDDRLNDREAFGVVAAHPSVSGFNPDATAKVKDLELSVKTSNALRSAFGPEVTLVDAITGIKADRERAGRILSARGIRELRETASSIGIEW